MDTADLLVSMHGAGASAAYTAKCQSMKIDLNTILAIFNLLKASGATIAESLGNLWEVALKIWQILNPATPPTPVPSPAESRERLLTAGCRLDLADRATEHGVDHEHLLAVRHLLATPTFPNGTTSDHLWRLALQICTLVAQNNRQAAYSEDLEEEKASGETRYCYTIALPPAAPGTTERQLTVRDDEMGDAQTKNLAANATVATVEAGPAVAMRLVDVDAQSQPSPAVIGWNSVGEIPEPVEGKFCVTSTTEVKP
jgi:hypothetical protein